jgi:hypothetical protein
MKFPPAVHHFGDNSASVVIQEAGAGCPTTSCLKLDLEGSLSFDVTEQLITKQCRLTDKQHLLQTSRQPATVIAARFAAAVPARAKTLLSENRRRSRQRAL